MKCDRKRGREEAGNKKEWKVKEGAGTTSATFGFVSSLVKTSAFDSHYAIYPFNANYQISENKHNKIVKNINN